MRAQLLNSAKPELSGPWRFRCSILTWSTIFEFRDLSFFAVRDECAHAWTASRLGDQTARLQGRVTLNPMYPWTPIGTLLFPAIMIFGGGFSALADFSSAGPSPTPESRAISPACP